MAVTFELNYQNKRYDSAYLGFMALAKNMGREADNFGRPLSIELGRFLKKAMTELSTRHSTAWPSGTSPTTLSRRSGGLAKALRESVTVSGGGGRMHEVRADIALPKNYVIHERGGTITAKKSKYLTIPLKAALRANGTPIRPRARDWPNTFVATSKKGNLLIFQKRGKEIVPLYVLKKSVKIPARMGLVSTVEAQMPAFIDKVFESLVDALMKA